MCNYTHNIWYSTTAASLLQQQVTGSDTQFVFEYNGILHVALAGGRTWEVLAMAAFSRQYSDCLSLSLVNIRPALYPAWIDSPCLLASAHGWLL
eukprot:12322-Heterococcus_DN1.PRE.2